MLAFLRVYLNLSHSFTVTQQTCPKNLKEPVNSVAIHNPRAVDGEGIQEEDARFGSWSRPSTQGAHPEKEDDGQRATVRNTLLTFEMFGKNCDFRSVLPHRLSIYGVRYQ